MARIRRGKLPTDHFTIVPNSYVRDNSLSWEARGLLAWLMSHAASFKVTEESMIEAGSFGRDGVRRMVRELESCGYLRRDKAFTPGSGTTVDYVLTDPYDGEGVVNDDGEGVVRAEQGQLDIFAGQPYDGEAVVPSYREDHKKIKTPSVSRPKLATRITEDYIPDEKMRAWFAAENLQRVIDVKAEHAKFVDHFLAAPGERGRKLDWPATWRNWMRKAAERAPYRPGDSLAPTSGAPRQYPSTTDGKVMQTLGLAEKFRQMEENQ